MTAMSDLPSWLREGINPKDGRDAASLDNLRNRVSSFRAAFQRLSYDDCLYILAKEFLFRKRPRAWMVNVLMGRLNRLRNEKFADDIAHLKTWVFRAGA